MNRVIAFTVSLLIFSSQTNANNCTMQKILAKKIATQVEQVNSLTETIQLNKKLEEINSWNEWSNVEKKDRQISMEEAESIFTAKEIDILLLSDTISDHQANIQKEMSVNVGYLAGSLASSYVTSKIITKLLNNGYKAGFMQKIHKLIVSGPDNHKQINKIKMITNLMALITPAYIGYKEYQLYKMLSDVKEKMKLIEELGNNLPELDLMEERIENDRILLRKLVAENDVECN